MQECVVLMGWVSCGLCGRMVEIVLFAVFTYVAGRGAKVEQTEADKAGVYGRKAIEEGGARRVI